jgi:Gas vesicle synthesis protein GvpL/GvpF
VSAQAPAATAVYVYGVVPGAPAAAIGARGVGSTPAPVRAVAGTGAAAVVSDVPADWRAARREDVAAHDAVLAELLAHGTVLPLRFGVVMASDEDVRQRLLAHHADALAELLARLDGHVQMTVRAYYVGEALLRGVLERHPQLGRRSAALEGRPPVATQLERIALGRDVAAAVDDQRAEDERALAAALAPHAADLRVDPPASDRQAASLQLLVPARERAALDAAVQRLAREHGDRLALRYVGPLAPYSFCDIALGDA